MLAKRSLAAIRSPLILPGCNFSPIPRDPHSFFYPFLPFFPSLPFLPFPPLLPLLPFFPFFPFFRSRPFELWRPLLQKCLCPLSHIFRSASHAEKRRLQEQPFFLRHFHAALDCFHREFHGERPIGDDSLRHCLRRGNQLSGFMDVIHQSDAQCCRRGAPLPPESQCVLPRAREDQHAHRLIITGVEQRVLQLLDGLAVQRIQHLRPIEGDVSNPVLLLVQQVLVSHRFFFLAFSALRAPCLCVLFLHHFFSTLKFLGLRILWIRIIVKPVPGLPPIPPCQDPAFQQRRRGKSSLLEFIKHNLRNLILRI